MVNSFEFGVAALRSIGIEQHDVLVDSLDVLRLPVVLQLSLHPGVGLVLRLQSRPLARPALSERASFVIVIFLHEFEN